jgi:hypothetical protein
MLIYVNNDEKCYYKFLLIYANFMLIYVNITDRQTDTHKIKWTDLCAKNVTLLVFNKVRKIR